MSPLDDENDQFEQLLATRLERARIATIFGLTKFPDQDELCSVLILRGDPLSEALILLTYDHDLNERKEPAYE